MGILIILILVPIFLIAFFLLDPFKEDRERKANEEWDKWVEPYKNTRIPDDYLVDNKEKSYKDQGYIRGERGGLYEIRISSRTGKPYRHYF